MEQPATRQEGVQLQPLNPLPLKEQVIRQLRRLIEDGVVRPGEQLPSERELSEQLRVSRGTVREAVQFLHALGLVAIRHGTGTFVAASAADPDELRSEWRDWTLRHSRRIHDLLEVRRGLESFAAELAAERIDQSGLVAIKDALEQMQAAVETGDIATLVEADVLFHRALCGATGNAALVELADTLGGKLLRERAALWDLPGRPSRSIEEHWEIYDAIRAGDPAMARSSVLAHLASVERDVDALLVSSTSDEKAMRPRRRRRAAGESESAPNEGER